jgi:hypothetical protein
MEIKKEELLNILLKEINVSKGMINAETMANNIVKKNYWTGYNVCAASLFHRINELN